MMKKIFLILLGLALIGFVLSFRLKVRTGGSCPVAKYQAMLAQVQDSESDYL